MALKKQRDSLRDKSKYITKIKVGRYSNQCFLFKNLDKNFIECQYILGKIYKYLQQENYLKVPSWMLSTFGIGSKNIMIIA